MEVSGLGEHDVKFPKYKELCFFFLKKKKYVANITTLYSIASTKQ